MQNLSLIAFPALCQLWGEAKYLLNGIILLNIFPLRHP